MVVMIRRLAMHFGALSLGCTVAANQPTAPRDDNRAGWSAPLVLASGQGRIAGGDFMVAVFEGQDNRLLLRRSSDNGASWTTAQELPFRGSIPLYRTFTASASALFLAYTGTDGNLYFASSTDVGGSWLISPAISKTAVERPHRVAIAIGGTQVLPVVHVSNGREFDAGADRRLFYWRSLDRGASFTDVTVLDSSPGGPVNPSLAATGSNVYVVYERWSEGQVYFRRSSDGGATWTLPVRLSDPAAGNAFRARVTLADDVVVATWQQDIPGSQLTQRIAVRRSLDGGASWSEPGYATPPDRRFNHQVVTSAAGGWVMLAFIEGDPGSTAATLQYTASRDYGLTWASPETVMVQSVAGTSQPFEIVARGGYVHILSGPEPALYTRKRYLQE